ncbi:RalF-like Dot/Icm system translocated protein [Nitzschia inconspicua]|uniref:RalF-like Dot/Icm system translocated protein n=1 Tax=Nitzschia inconspicua TaxID=303405 RepID=A0A9K3M4P4_9STRA|nr:RalF-like Dot/Icm system translocated protein [Nitzschia inconspicua]
MAPMIATRSGNSPPITYNNSINHSVVVATPSESVISNSCDEDTGIPNAKALEAEKGIATNSRIATEEQAGFTKSKVGGITMNGTSSTTSSIKSNDPIEKLQQEPLDEETESPSKDHSKEADSSNDLHANGPHDKGYDYEAEVAEEEEPITKPNGTRNLGPSTKRGNPPTRTLSASGPSLQSFNSSASAGIGVASTVPAALLIQPNNVCKVIKGEIHNVLNVLRTDARYVSPLRFMEELPSDEQHPLLLQLRELHEKMSEWELTHHDHRQPEAKLYLPPFCAAIQGRDISAKVTGAALQSIQKFLLYGFLTNEGPAAFTTIANTLLLCTFEESSNANGTSTTSSVADDASGSIRRGRNNSDQNSSRYDDEQVVMKLLDLSALIVRSASSELSPEVVVGLLDTCLHVSHRAKRASTLLKSAASDAMAQMILEVFSHPNMASAREAILAKLASLLNPNQSATAHVVNSLTLVNIALETLTDDLTENEVSILQNDLCKFLLSWSATHDLVILSLTMRVIFNLFQTIRNHLKVPLEVFLTSVHLRILEHSANPEEREVALESLLEFCQEPALIKDLYLNYDCDVQCTNLYASICTTLGNVAAPGGYRSFHQAVEMDTNVIENGLVAKKEESTIAQKAAAAAAEVPLNILNVLALESLLTIVESIARRCTHSNLYAATSSGGSVGDKQKKYEASKSFTHSSGDTFDMDDMEMSEEELQERKRRKAALSKVAKLFNKDPDSHEWIKLGEELEVLEENASSVALALYTAPGLDKDKLGDYLGKGPIDKYPFHHSVRLAFVQLFDFTHANNFASALRMYLHKFRLPGEAQQIDRFMDAFSKEYYKQQGKDTVFRNSDAVFVLAFSTIMLNTDLHNPNIKNKKRMTRHQFVKNNQGINAGSDLPEAMLNKLYTDIREQELQVQREIGEFISHSDAQDAEHFKSAWGDMLRKNVAAASFTDKDEARRTMFEAGVHEKDMFLVICKPALRSISSAFVRSWDDGNVASALKGLEQMAKISTFFGLDNILNEIIAFLLIQGREFINGCVALEYAGIVSGAPINHNQEDDDETMTSFSIVDADSPIPHTLLMAKEIAKIDTRKVDVTGAAAYRGLLALNMGLRIVRTLFPRVRSAWPQLIEVFGALRDARALPPGLADLDDFADSDGNVLPLSLFARNSQKRLDDFYRIKAGKEGNTKQGWFKLSGFFGRGKGKGDGAPKPMSHQASEQGRLPEMSANAQVLLAIAERCEIEKFMVLGPNLRLQLVKQSLKGMLDSIDKLPSNPSPTYEQHIAFALELAARALLADTSRAVELFPFFLVKFQSLAQKLSKLKKAIPIPFLTERVVVTILRASIHLYQIPEMRTQLRTSLFLLPAFPKPFMGHIADRSACGFAIIWGSSYSYFKSPEDLKFIADTFDHLASFRLGRGLTFDGIASTIENALPDASITNILAYEDKIKESSTLSLGACTALQRVLFKYIYGAYEGDFSLAVPAMVCVEKTYHHMVQLMQIAQKNDPKIDPELELPSVPDLELWQRIAVAFYSMCNNPDPEISKRGLEGCVRHIFVSDVTEIPDKRWIALFNTMTVKQAPVSATTARVNSLSMIAQLMIKVFPDMTLREENWKILTEVTKQVAEVADYNMASRRAGNRDSEELFDLTATVVTQLAGQLVSPKFGGERRYCKWASDTFVKILEKNRATGVAAAAAKAKSNSNTDEEQHEEPTEPVGDFV